MPVSGVVGMVMLLSAPAVAISTTAATVLGLIIAAYSFLKFVFVLGDQKVGIFCWILSVEFSFPYGLVFQI